jgi:hypothetical protein
VLIGHGPAFERRSCVRTQVMRSNVLMRAFDRECCVQPQLTAHGTSLKQWKLGPARATAGDTAYVDCVRL